jgi:outer membrane protein assembly factor BamB
VPGPPAVAGDGTAYIGTSDGSLEAIGPDGVLRWSVTFEGSVAWAPILDDTGRVYVATTAQKIHSFLPSGVRGWVLRAPVHIATDPVLSVWGLLFGGSDGSLWAVSPRGFALWHSEIKEPLSVGPGVHGRRIVVGTVNGDAVFFDGASKRFGAQLGGRVRCPPVVFRDGSAALLAGTSLYRLDPRAAVVWRRDGIDWIGSEGDDVYAVSDQGELIRFSTDGAATRHVPLGAPASGPPAVDPSGAVFVPADSGEIVVIRADGSTTAVKIANAPLYRPTTDPARRRLVVTAGDGTLAAVTLPN